jgi:hypothetical protein
VYAEGAGGMGGRERGEAGGEVGLELLRAVRFPGGGIAGEYY